MNVLRLFLISILAAQTTLGQLPSVKPKEGFVPDAATAIKIAEAIWIPIYGARQISGEKPFHADLENGVWTVEGSMPSNPLGEPMFGGVAHAEIRKSDGKVLRVYHEE